MTTAAIDYTDYAQFLSEPDGSRTSVLPQSNYCILLMQKQPPNMSSDALESRIYNIKTDFDYIATDDANTTITHETSSLLQHETQTVTGNQATPLWTTTAQATFENVNNADPNVRSIGENVGAPNYVVVRMKGSYTSDNFADVAAIGNVWFKHVPDTADPHTAIQAPTTGTTMYAPDYPISAWHVRQSLIESLNAIMSECIQRVCVPVYGQSDDE